MTRVSTTTHLCGGGLIKGRFLCIFSNETVRITCRTGKFHRLANISAKLSTVSFCGGTIDKALRTGRVFFSSRRPCRLYRHGLMRLDGVTNVIASRYFVLRGVAARARSFRFNAASLTFILYLGHRGSTDKRCGDDGCVIRSLQSRSNFTGDRNTCPIARVLSGQGSRPFCRRIVCLSRKRDVRALPPLTTRLMHLASRTKA